MLKAGSVRAAGGIHFCSQCELERTWQEEGAALTAFLFLPK